jgi:hypothetical protein
VSDNRYRSYRLVTRRDAAEHELRRTEVELLRRQVSLGYWNVVGAVTLSFALVTITLLQWRTAESTASIERAKAQPHFRVRQENQHDELGFMPRRFSIEADTGISDATEARSVSVMKVNAVSQELGVRWNCEASFPNFYGWTNDALSFELNAPAARFLDFSRKPDQKNEAYLRLQPVRVLLTVSFTDIFGVPRQQDLMLSGGTPRRLNAGDMEEKSRTGASFSILTNAKGSLVVYVLPGTPLSHDCRAALGVMSRIPWLRMARPGEQPQDIDQPFLPDHAVKSRN